MIAVWIHCGCEKIWPKSGAGGFPGTVLHDFQWKLPMGSVKFVEQCRAENVPEEKDLPDHEVLGNRIRAMMQTEYDKLLVQLLEIEGTDADAEKQPAAEKKEQ